MVRSDHLARGEVLAVEDACHGFDQVDARLPGHGDLPLQDRVGVDRDLQGGGNVTFHRSSLPGGQARGDSKVLGYPGSWRQDWSTELEHVAAQALPARDRIEARIRDG
ncbi:hypothetical protein GCM10011610_10910 [Nocardia rhizosphaerihabitans]|uniref:Uncharacterized protein n=1 Tax=Nocardia rhizosphaerihabitans TaxID=1691570 RepID=A0ABQ2K5N1_9NOCA|nr:hypothetical protein GCM10011610_10910 [Nocardia rhizosphaerihabitans]